MAKHHYSRGLAHYNLQEYTAAIEEFEWGYRRYPDPVFLYNLGQAHRLTNSFERSLYFYKTYLRADPKAANRREVEGRIVELERVLAEQKMAAQRPPETTQPPPEPPPPAPPPRVVLAPPFALAGTPPPPTSEPPRVEPAPPLALKAAPPPRRKPVYKQWWLWTLVGVGVAGAATGLALGLTLGRPAPNSYPAVSF